MGQVYRKEEVVAVLSCISLIKSHYIIVNDVVVSIGRSFGEGIVVDIICVGLYLNLSHKNSLLNKLSSMNSIKVVHSTCLEAKFRVEKLRQNFGCDL